MSEGSADAFVLHVAAVHSSGGGGNRGGNLFLEREGRSEKGLSCHLGPRRSLALCACFRFCSCGRPVASCGRTLYHFLRSATSSTVTEAAGEDGCHDDREQWGERCDRENTCGNLGDMDWATGGGRQAGADRWREKCEMRVGGTLYQLE